MGPGANGLGIWRNRKIRDSLAARGDSRMSNTDLVDIDKCPPLNGHSGDFHWSSRDIHASLGVRDTPTTTL